MSGLDGSTNLRDLPPFAALRAFEAVFRTGGIRKAAASLSINHAVVSRHLRMLENWVGVPLVHRTGNRLYLTVEGARYHAAIGAALADIAVATEDLVGLTKARAVRLWCTPSLSIQWLSNQLADFEHEHPQFSVDLKPNVASPDFLRHEADADIRYLRDRGASALPKGLIRYELARPDMMVVASPELAARLGPAVSASDLLQQQLLHEDDQTEWSTWFTLNGVDVPADLPGQLCWHALLALAAARLGRGVALASHFLVASDLARGELVELKPLGAKRVPLGSYVLIAREDQWSKPALSALRHFLRGRAQQAAPMV